MNCLQALVAIQNTKGSKAKLAKLEELKDTPHLSDVFYMACAGSVNFFHSKVFKQAKGTDHLEANPQQVMELLDAMRNREYPGTNARNIAIQAALCHAHPDDVDLFNRIIKKSLKCGLGESAANAVWGDGFIPHFPVMLIDPHCNKKAAAIVNGRKGAVMQLKSDGVRCIIHGHSNAVTGYSTRQGEELLGLDKVFSEAIQDAIEDTFMDLEPQDKWGIDGEMCVIENGVHNFSKANGIMQRCQDGTATEAEIHSLTYVVWDIYFRDGDESDYEERLFWVEDFISFMPTYLAEKCPTWRVSNIEEVHDKFREIVKTGNEGVVLKSLSNVWKDARVSDCIKYKEKHRASMLVTGWYLGEEGDKYQNVLGGINIESACGMVKSNSGSGITDDQRGILYVGGKAQKDENGHFVRDPDFNIDKYVDAIVEIEYNQRTRNKNLTEEDPFSLRFPIVKALPRVDKTEADTLERMIEEEQNSYGLRTE